MHACYMPTYALMRIRANLFEPELELHTFKNGRSRTDKKRFDFFETADTARLIQHVIQIEV